MKELLSESSYIFLKKKTPIRRSACFRVVCDSRAHTIIIHPAMHVACIVYIAHTTDMMASLTALFPVLHLYLFTAEFSS